MSEARDPRIDPRCGDVICQSSGTILRVTQFDGEAVAWQRKKHGRWVDDNSWSLRGWRSCVANGAEVIDVEPSAEKGGGV